MSKQTDFQTAFTIVGAWQSSKNINVSNFKALDLSRDQVHHLLTDLTKAVTTSGIRIYLARDLGGFKGVAVQTVDVGNQHDDITPNHSHGQNAFYYLLSPPSRYPINTMSQPSVAARCATSDYVATSDNHITWACATNWAYGWQNNNITKGSDIKALFIPKQDLLNALSEIPGEVGVRFYFANFNNGDYKGVTIGRDSGGNDLAPRLYTDRTSYLAYDFCEPCPSRCGEANQLNKLLG